MEFVKRRWPYGNGRTEDLCLAEWMCRRPKYQRLVFENERNGEVGKGEVTEIRQIYVLIALLLVFIR